MRITRESSAGRPASPSAARKRSWASRQQHCERALRTADGGRRRGRAGEPGRGIQDRHERGNEGRIGSARRWQAGPGASPRSRRRYVKTRSQFGKDIAEFQGASQLARAATDLEASRDSRLQRRPPPRRRPAVPARGGRSHAACVGNRRRVASLASSCMAQLYTRDYPVEKLYRTQQDRARYTKERQTTCSADDSQNRSLTLRTRESCPSTPGSEDRDVRAREAARSPRAGPFCCELRAGGVTTTPTVAPAARASARRARSSAVWTPRRRERRQRPAGRRRIGDGALDAQRAPPRPPYAVDAGKVARKPVEAIVITDE